MPAFRELTLALNIVSLIFIFFEFNMYYPVHGVFHWYDYFLGPWITGLPFLLSTYIFANLLSPVFNLINKGILRFILIINILYIYTTLDPINQLLNYGKTTPDQLTSLAYSTVVLIINIIYTLTLLSAISSNSQQPGRVRNL